MHPIFQALINLASLVTQYFYHPKKMTKSSGSVLLQ